MTINPDDNVSTASGMDNSMTRQVNPSRRLSRMSHGYLFPMSQYPGYLPSGNVPPGNAFSPALNSEGRGSSLVSSDRGQAPPGLISSGTSDLTDNTFNTREYAGYATGQDFGSISQAEYSEQPFQRLASQFSPIRTGQNAHIPNYQDFGKQFGSEPANQAIYSQNVPLQHDQARSGSAVSFLGSDTAPAVTGPSFTRPSLIRHGSSQTFSTRSASLVEGHNDFDLQVDSSQTTQYIGKVIAPDVHAPIHRGSQLSQNEMFDPSVEAHHSYLQYPMPSHFNASLPREDQINIASSRSMELVDDESYNPSNETAARQTSEDQGEAEARQARSHPLYSAGPRSDDLYHCPWATSENCPHKPTKLKCVYDKYIDSHLRPFRCKSQICATLQFSSTACLLRHEREAHGMHGHGAKPHLCSYKDCERSIPGNGFPRRYNLFDHMKRVHDYKAPASPPAESADGAHAPAGPKRQNVRKRKSGPDPGETQAPEKRNKAEMSTKESEASASTSVPIATQRNRRQSQIRRRFEAMWKDRHGEVAEQFQRLEGPGDVAGLQQLRNSLKGLSDIAVQWKEWKESG
ncbi:MAG: hypothetical protein M1822_002894 [Bathelium mastoideum]|nr:MAG: hypothetical protein M1822_002894 [Bathelium mastoideum]